MYLLTSQQKEKTFGKCALAFTHAAAREHRARSSPSRSSHALWVGSRRLPPTASIPWKTW